MRTTLALRITAALLLFAADGAIAPAAASPRRARFAAATALARPPQASLPRAVACDGALAFQLALSAIATAP